MKIKLLFALLYTISINAFSQIISVNINQTIIGPGTRTLDLNNDGTNDFTFDIINLPSNVFAARVLTNNSSTILDNSTFGYPDTLNFGNPVTGYFHTGTGVLGTFNNAGQFRGAGDKYLGVKINASGNNHSGWIKLNCSVNRDTLKIISFGYTIVASAPINAGQTAVTGISKNADNTEDLTRIYPNPFSSLTTFWTAHPVYNATLTITNSYGQTVKQITKISGQSVTLSRDNLATGLYVVQLTQGNEVIAKRKLIITD